MATSETTPAPPTATTPSALQDEAPRDAEGLLLQYDVIVCGTGLVQSILASALSRAGWSVLHCDAAEYYGELDAVWTLPYLQEMYKKTKTKKETLQAEVLQDPENNITNRIPLASAGECQSLCIHSMQSKTDFAVTEGTVVSTPYGSGTVVRCGIGNDDADADATNDSNQKDADGSPVVSQKHVTIELTNWTLADQSHPRLYTTYVPAATATAASPSTSSASFSFGGDSKKSKRIVMEPAAAVRTRTILRERSRSLALDVTPRLVYAAGAAVDGLITSGVADYLEWKALEGLLFLNSSSKQAAPKLNRVPCNKNDVFGSQLLSPMDKRRLMKFLQLAMDYGTALQSQQELQEYQQEQQQQEQQTAETNNNNNNAVEPEKDATATTTATATNVQSLNERHLNQGRSLARPQNKTVATGDMQILQDCIAEGTMDFETYLREKQRLSPSLISLVRYALALETTTTTTSTASTTTTSSVSLEQGMTNLCRHMGSLGRFGPTAFLVPLYGSGELPQAFCRSAAVYGATYVLRRAPDSIVVTDDKTDSSSNQKNKRVAGVVLLGSNDDDDHHHQEEPSSPKQVSCSHVIVPSGALLSSSQQQQQQEPNVIVWRRISVIRGKPVLPSSTSHDQHSQQQQQQQQRHVVIIPPNTASVGNETVIHGLLLDETSNVAPAYVEGGCTVLHLTMTTTTTTTTTTATTTEEGKDTEDHASYDHYETMLKRALDSILSESNKDNVEEIFHVFFSYALQSSSTTSTAASSPRAGIEGLHMIDRQPPGVEADPEFAQAKSIFHRIVGSSSSGAAKFLEISQAMDTAIQERLGEAAATAASGHAAQDDDERYVLDSAVNMISKAPETTTTTTTTTTTSSSNGNNGSTDASQHANKANDGSELLPSSSDTTATTAAAVAASSTIEKGSAGDDV